MLSQTAEYALRTVLFIAGHADEGPARAEEMAAALRIPRNYLSKTLHRLAQAGVLTSTRGRGGGFLLARSPADIPLLAVVGLFDQIEPRRQCLLGRPVCSDQHACEAHVQWKDVSERVARFFSETSVADLMGPGPTRGKVPGGARAPGPKGAAVARRR
jgi:Rrf2 family iron-sulfur cluster assembly transcriptional regulator